MSHSIRNRLSREILPHRYEGKVALALLACGILLYGAGLFSVARGISLRSPTLLTPISSGIFLSIAGITAPLWLPRKKKWMAPEGLEHARCIETRRGDVGHLTQPICRKGRWLHRTDQANHAWEAALIGLETQAKRLGRFLTAGRCFRYFDGERTVYQKTEALESSEVPMVQNIGHATLFFQMENMNILTDPVFYDLNALLYPRKTEPGLLPEELPQIDVILISHNHRDHCDVPSLKALLPWQPVMLVPYGDLKFFKDLGFTNVCSHEWWTTSTVEKRGKQLLFHAVPACHWSGRGAFDAQKSQTCSWVFHAPDQNAIYFRGDTANVPQNVMDEIKVFVVPQIKANFQPGGPNHRRSLMESTHQSIFDSMLTYSQFPDCETYLMHHNTFELGTDRFDEAVILKDQILAHLNNETNPLPPFVDKGRIEDIPIFQSAMRDHFHSPKIGERRALNL